MGKAVDRSHDLALLSPHRKPWQMDLAGAAEQLYGLGPDEFTAERNELAKQVRGTGDKALAEAIRQLRRPSTSAWVVNVLARQQAAELDELLTLGSALRQAQHERDRDRLRELNGRRHGVVATAARQARAAAEELGHPVSESITAEVEQTLFAAMVDVDAEAAVLSGQLISALISTGFEPVDVAAAVAVPDALTQAPGRQSAPCKASDAGRTAKRDAPTQRATATQDAKAAQVVQAAIRKADAAEQDAAASAAKRDEAERALHDAIAQRSDASAQLEEMERHVRQLREEIATKEHDVRSAQRVLDKATRAAGETQRAAAKARSRADLLTRPSEK